MTVNHEKKTAVHILYNDLACFGQQLIANNESAYYST